MCITVRPAGKPPGGTRWRRSGKLGKVAPDLVGESMRRALVLVAGLWACDDGASTTPADGGGVGDAARDAARDAAGAQDAAEDAAPDAATTPRARIEGVPETAAFEVAGLEAPVHVVRTEVGVPHIYAENRNDLGRVLGFVVARDRYFILDLQRRLGLGTLTELLGDAGLESDVEARLTGMTHVADRLLAHLSPELGAYLDAFAAGMNDYIAAVGAGQVEPPSEYRVARALLGAARDTDLMQPWSRRDVAAMVAVVMYRTTFETDDVGRQRGVDAVNDGLYSDPAAFQAELRRAGFLGDLWENVTPHFFAASAAGLGLETATGFEPGPLPAGLGGPGQRPGQRPGQQPGQRPAPGPAEAHRLPAALLERTATRLKAFEERLGRDREKGFGSNAWAVAGSASTDGASLTAGDGHLSLSVPALMYQIGLDTQALGGGPLHQAGLLLTGMPVLAVGTNGRVAWSQVNPVFDITDWYGEQLRVGPDGRPDAARFQGEWRPLVAVPERFVVANVPALDSVGREEMWTRYTTFDGRFILNIEGWSLEDMPMGTPTLTQDGPVVVGDVNGDGVISAISFDYAAFDATNYIDTLDQLGFADDVEHFRDITRGLVGSGLFSAAGDHKGDILFTAYQGVPCRSTLPRGDDDRWLPGADPTLLLDGATHGAFHLPMVDGRPVSDPVDPSGCVVPFESVPQALSPARGFVQTANNDPGGLTHDGRLDNDAWYLGGPWDPNRSDTIHRALAQSVAADTADVAMMSVIQSNDESRLGELFAPRLVQAIEAGRVAASTDGEVEAHVARLAGLYRQHTADFDAVAARLTAWSEGGYNAASGVLTVYHTPDARDRADAVATMLFNAWFPRFMRGVFDDEGIPAWRYSASRMQVRALKDYLAARGPTNDAGHAAWFAETGEAIFFDVLGTPEVERSDEVMLQALVSALEFLRTPPEGDATGGFGDAPMEAWLWGLRHVVRFDSLLAEFLGADSGFGAILSMFAITPRTLPLTEERLTRDDPRFDLTGFPRPGDNWGVDGANAGFSGTRFSYGSGPVMRMVIALKDGDVSGVNVIPGGQSALTTSPHFADQTRLWLGNETVPLRFSVEQVVEGAVGREVYRPAP